jgi:ketosteroid isomerase-like protein
MSDNAAIQELLDKQAIRELVARISRGVDRGDVALLASCYHPDAKEERDGHIREGGTIASEIVESTDNSMRSTCHILAQQLIEVRGDKAVSETYATGRHVFKDGRLSHTVVRYADRFEKRDGEWKVIYRLAVAEARETHPAPEGPAFNGLARRDKTDPTYALFEG